MQEHLTRAHSQILVKDSIICGTQAQIIVQHLHLRKMKEALYTREQEKGGKEETIRIAPDVHGQVLNSVEMEAKVVEADERKKRKERDKVERREVLREKKRRKVEQDAKWKRMLEDWSREKERWAKEVETLKAIGATKKELPAAPRKPRKKDLDCDQEEEAGGLLNDDPELGHVDEDGSDPGGDRFDMDFDDADVELASI